MWKFGNLSRKMSGVDDVTGNFPRFIGQINGGQIKQQFEIKSI